MAIGLAVLLQLYATHLSAQSHRIHAEVGHQSASLKVVPHVVDSRIFKKETVSQCGRNRPVFPFL